MFSLNTYVDKEKNEKIIWF